MLRDVRMAMRSLRRRPVFLVVATISLAIGIGANTAMFGTLSAALLRPLPFEEPERLVMGRTTWDPATKTVSFSPVDPHLANGIFVLVNDDGYLRASEEWRRYE